MKLKNVLELMPNNVYIELLLKKENGVTIGNITGNSEAISMCLDLNLPDQNVEGINPVIRNGQPYILIKIVK